MPRQRKRQAEVGIGRHSENWYGSERLQFVRLGRQGRREGTPEARPFLLHFIHLHLSHEVTRVTSTKPTKTSVSCTLLAAPARVQMSETQAPAPQPGDPKGQSPLETWHQTVPMGPSLLGHPCRARDGRRLTSRKALGVPDPAPPCVGVWV